MRILLAAFSVVFLVTPTQAEDKKPKPPPTSSLGGIKGEAVDDHHKATIEIESAQRQPGVPKPAQLQSTPMALKPKTAH
jgi:hypothetical protein